MAQVVAVPCVELNALQLGTIIVIVGAIAFGLGMMIESIVRNSGNQPYSPTFKPWMAFAILFCTFFLVIIPAGYEGLYEAGWTTFRLALEC